MLQLSYYQEVISRRLLSGLFILLYASSLNAQIEFKAENSSEDSIIINRLLASTWTVKNTSNALIKLDEVRSILQHEGFFDTNYRIHQKDSTNAIYNIEPGDLYLWDSVSFSQNLDIKYLIGTGIRDVAKKGQAFHQNSLLQSIKKILNNLANDGFPFASLKIDRLNIKNGKISAQLNLSTGNKYFIQDIEVNGNAQISKSYLKHYLGLKKGKEYSQATILSIHKKLNEVPFLKQSGTPGVRFYKENAQIYVHLDDQPADQFDIILGFQPNPPGSAKRFNLIGKAFMSLQNNLHYGEKISLNYNGQGQTQELKINGLFPYILDSPFGFEGDFSLYYKDLEYLRLAYQMAVQYALEGENYISTFWRNQQSNLVDIDTSLILINQSLPKEQDYTINDVGLSFHFEKLDYKFNPTNGWIMDLSLAIGNKTIQKNAILQGIKGLNIDSLYNDIKTSSIRADIQFSSAVYWPINRRSTIKTSIQGAGIFNNALILDNEKYRIGGTNLLRGFNEDQFISSWYGVGGIEYRFLISQNGFLSAFSDFSYINSDVEVDGETLDDILALSFGLGFSFETNIGIFQLNYAVGRTQTTSWDLTNGKLHFGYLNIF